jgi:prevent-host-death family protein
MMSVGLREANQHFSKLLKLVRGGEEVTLTERGRPIARIIPILSCENDTEVAIQRAVAAGLLRPATKPWGMPAFTPRRLRGPSTAQALREERDSD